MKCRLLFLMEAGPSAPDDICIFEDGKRFLEAGTVLDHPDAYRLVHAGHAEAVDDECREKAATMNMTTKGLLRKVHNRIMNEMEDFQDELKDLEELEAEDELDDDE